MVDLNPQVQPSSKPDTPSTSFPPPPIPPTGGSPVGGSVNPGTGAGVARPAPAPPVPPASSVNPAPVFGASGSVTPPPPVPPVASAPTPPPANTMPKPDPVSPAPAAVDPHANHNSFIKPIPKTYQRVNVNDRRIINGSDEADVVQLSPMKHKFAWDAYLDANANHWLPTEISMQRDIELWKDPNGLSEDERLAFKRVMGFFTTGDSIVANNLVLSIYRHITSPECRMYLLRQAFEEAIHTHAYQYMVESLEMDEGEIFNMYREVDSIRNKDNLLLDFSIGVLNENFTTASDENARKFLENLIGFYVICEGLFFYTSFAVVLSFQRQNKLVGSAEQIQYIMRDESMHMNFGIDMIHHIRQENPHLWDPALEKRIYGAIDKAVELETIFAKDCFPKGILGINSDLFEQYMQHIADRRLERIKLEPQYNVENPFPWMSEAIDLSKEKNFFESRVTEYQTGGTLEW